MPILDLKSILCCLRSSPSSPTPEIDENTHLIPEQVEDTPTVTGGSGGGGYDRAGLQERLGGIVRAKEGKMVNVTSLIPFNLHNQAIPPELLKPKRYTRGGGGGGYYGSASVSRSTSVSRWDGRSGSGYDGYGGGERGYGGGYGGGERDRTGGYYGSNSYHPHPSHYSQPHEDQPQQQPQYGHLHPRYYESHPAYQLSLSDSQSHQSHSQSHPGQSHYPSHYQDAHYARYSRGFSMSPSRGGVGSGHGHGLAQRPTKPILNVRLVRVAPRLPASSQSQSQTKDKKKNKAKDRDDRRRGRSRERRKRPSGLGITIPNDDEEGSATASEGDDDEEEEEVMTPRPGVAPQKMYPLEIKDIGIALSWGD